MCRTDFRLIFFVMWGAPPYKVGSVLVTLTYSEVKNKNLLFSLSNGQPRILIVPKIPSLYLGHFGEVGWPHPLHILYIVVAAGPTALPQGEETARRSSRIDNYITRNS